MLFGNANQLSFRGWLIKAQEQNSITVTSGRSINCWSIILPNIIFLRVRPTHTRLKQQMLNYGIISLDWRDDHVVSPAVFKLYGSRSNCLSFVTTNVNFTNKPILFILVICLNLFPLYVRHSLGTRRILAKEP